MATEFPTSRDWIRFLTKVRSSFVSSERRLKNNEPFSNSCYRFYHRNRKSIPRFGLERLFLRTISGNIQRVFSLSESGGHVKSDSRLIPDPGELEVSKSRALAMYGLVDRSGVARRVQVLAQHHPTSQQAKKEIESFCNYLVQEFILQESTLYFQAIENGIRETRRLLQMTKFETILPGTAALKLTRKVSQSICAKVGAFCVVGTEGLLIEYLSLNNKSSSPPIAKGSEISVSDTAAYIEFLMELKSRGRLALDPDHPVYREFARLIPGLLNGVKLEGEELWAVPVRYDEETLAVLLFAFPVASYEFSNAAYNLANLAAEALSRPARYLFQRRIGKVIMDPIFKSRETRIVKDQGFLIMPFGQLWSDSVAEIVRETLTSLGVSVIRADEMHGENVMEDVWTALLSSQYVVADVTGKNPNVYYELGIAHTLGKRVILLTQDIKDIPFDTRHLRHIKYSNDLSGHQSIRTGITGFIGL